MSNEEIQNILSLFYLKVEDNICEANETAIAAVKKLSIDFAREMCDKQKDEILEADGLHFSDIAKIRKAPYPKELQ